MKMRFCGVEIKGKEAFFAQVAKTDEGIIHLPLPTKRLALIDDELQVSVRHFFDTISALFRNNQIDVVAIKKRNQSGEFAGGGMTFKIEGLVQLNSDREVQLLSPQTISASNRRHTFPIPSDLYKYQAEAYLTACCAASR
jgi:hypothetical protein